MKEVSLKVRFKPDMECSLDCDFAPINQEPSFNKCLLFQQELNQVGYGSYVRCIQCFQRFEASK